MDTGFLTRKLGPLPAWAYLLGAAALVALIMLYRRGQSSLGQTGSAIPASPYASSDQGLLNYPPTVVVTPAGISNTPSSPPLTQPSGSTSPGGFMGLIGPQPQGYQGIGVGYFSSKDDPGSTIGYIPWNTQVTITGAPVQGRNQLAFPGGPGSSVWYPISYAGKSGWLNQIAFSGFSGTPPQGGGMGGTVQTLHLEGVHQRNTAWGHFSPFMPQQFVDTGRGGAGEGDGMGGVSRRTGIPVTRLQSLNYHLRGRSGSYDRGIIRIA